MTAQPASEVSQAVLRVVEGGTGQRDIPIGEQLALGRATEGEGRIRGDPSISRHHARVVRTSTNALLLVDAGSSNGTFVNGERVSSRELQPGDTIKIGATTLELAQAMGPPRETKLHVIPSVEAPDPAELRAEFPVFERLLYLQTGTDGPIPRRAADAVREQLEVELAVGRGADDYWGVQLERWAELRDRYSFWLGCDPVEVALTRAATDGVNTVLSGLDLRHGDEILTSDEEHPGMLAPLACMRERHGVRIVQAPFRDIASGVTPRTRLIACSHVSWMTGSVVDVDAIRESGLPVLLDGAQALGAIPVDVRAIGCDFYAAPGQKWLCGPDRSGCLFVREDRIEDISPPVWPNYLSLADPGNPLDLPLVRGAGRFDPGILPGVMTRWVLASLDVLEERGRRFIVDRGPTMAARLAEMLAEAGVEVTPRGRSTLVTFACADAQAAVERWADEGVIVRDIPGRDQLRASIGAWCLDEDLERVVGLAAR